MFSRQRLYIYILVFLLVVSYCNPVFARPVYQWTDDQGVVHFTSEKPSPNARPAKLPEINRGEVKLTKKALVSCGNHGGIDCQAGPDTDGSVICYDGFKDGSPRYRFSCSSPKLEITEVSPIAPDGSFTVYVRNSKAVDASRPAVFFRPGEGKKSKLKGPVKIEAFGLAEFHFLPEGDLRPTGGVTVAQLDISCANCP